MVKVLTIAGLVAMMLSMGLKVSLEDVLASTRKLRPVLLGLLSNFVLVPAVTVALLYLFDAHPMVSMGFLVLAVCPGAPVAPPFTALARGDVPCAIGQMILLSGLSALLSPALLGVLSGFLVPATDLRIDYLAIVRTLLVAQMLPLAIGLGIHYRNPALATRAAGTLGVVANLLLLVAIALVLADEYESLETIRLRGWVGMLLLLASSLGLGWLSGGPALVTRKALALTTAVRNAAVALVIVSSGFAGTAAVTAVVAYSLVSIFGGLACAWLLRAAMPGDPRECTGVAASNRSCAVG